MNCNQKLWVVVGVGAVVVVGGVLLFPKVSAAAAGGAAVGYGGFLLKRAMLAFLP